METVMDLLASLRLLFLEISVKSCETCWKKDRLEDFASRF